MISPFYGINPAQAENPYFFLYLFQDLNDVIMSYKFRGVIILEGEDLGAKEVNERRLEDQNRGSHVATVSGCVGPPISALVAPFASILLPEASSWPKNDYKNSPPTFSRRRRWRNTKPEIEIQKAATGEDRRGKRRRNPPPEGSTPLRCVHHQLLQQDHLISPL